MSLVGAARVDKKLIAHLSHGGDVGDSVSSILITQLIRESLENAKIGAAVRHHGISNDLLASIYRSSIEELLPEPMIRHGIAPILVPSLIFIDENFLPRLIDHWVSTAQFTQDVVLRSKIIEDTAVEFIVGLRDTADSQGKVMPWPMVESPTLEKLEGRGGCFGLILMLASLTLGTVAALKYA